MEVTKYVEDIAEFMEMDLYLAEEYVKELEGIFASNDWESEFDWTSANVESFYPGKDVMEEIASADGINHDIEQFVGVVDDTIIYTHLLRIVENV